MTPTPRHVTSSPIKDEFWSTHVLGRLVFVERINNSLHAWVGPIGCHLFRPCWRNVKIDWRGQP